MNTAVAKARTADHNNIDDTLYVSDFGLKPNTKENAVQAVYQALKKAKGMKNPVLAFAKGRYDFWPDKMLERTYFESNTTDNNPKRLAIFIETMQHLTIDGKGSSFVFHDRIQPITIEKSEQIVIKNLAIDWEFPLTAQALVVDTNSNYLDISLDAKQYPYSIVDGKIIFSAEGWKGVITGVMEVDKETNLIAYNTGDNPSALGSGWQKYTAEKLGKDIVRLHYAFKRKPAKGNILILRHNDRDHALMFINESRNVHIQDVNAYHCAGLGILSQYAENVSFERVNIVPNKTKGRYFSGHDDGLHFSNCRGTIKVEACMFEGLMDDPINVHGTYVRIIRKLGSNKLLCRFMEHMSTGMPWARAGENIAFIDNTSMKTVGNTTVQAFKQISTTDFELTLTSAIPSTIQEGFGLENMDWTPTVLIRTSTFGGNRARGVLVSTPKSIRIEHNVFKSSGSAVLIAGDVNSWYESGAVTDCLIKGNKFLSSCNNSLYQFTEAIISIFPEIPVMNEQTDRYHRNIRMEDNVFFAFDYPILFAQSVDGLSFKHNQLHRSYEFKPFHPRKATFTLIGCRNAQILDNTIDPELLGKNVVLEYMDTHDLRLQDDFILSH
ncbi:right-handed parallel beta-helix repeat-containing protein [Olivibacter ginsenosidimutans]|uniref:Right-handed parallel beta-helix repeat-containing protein n=1 Tax=Olivibacter ginsenosidimutans TaxID=1176537 RepID=A0ABP9CA88_9SPHI